MTGIRGQDSGVRNQKEVSICSLKRRAEFLAIAKNGKKWVTPGFILQMSPSLPTVIRYGLTASSKIGNAVVRNRGRRRLRALAHEVLAQQAVPGHDFVLIARMTTGSRAYVDLKKDLIWALKKLGVHREKTA
jgi:ribonuclease P protein component